MRHRFVGEQGPTGAPADAEPPTHDPARLRQHLSTIRSLGALTASVNQAGTRGPLNRHPGLHVQMRRAAIDALTHAACDLEPASLRDHRDLMLRTLVSLGELDTCTRFGATNGALTTAEAEGIAELIRSASRSVRTSLRQHPSALQGVA